MSIKKILFLLGGVCCLSFPVVADNLNGPSVRSGKWEATFMLTHNDERFLQGQALSSVDIKEATGWGASVGYNFNEHFLVNLEMLSSVPNYQATFVTDEVDPQLETINHKMNVVHTQLNAVYNFSAERLSPFVQGGVGWTYVDSNIADGPAQGICWWDPWWGYVCDGFQPTYHESNFSYNLGVGLRYELSNEMIFKVSYRRSYSELNGNTDLNLDIFTFEIGAFF
ncbi:outer membrane beta-barrel protein [Thalassotalea sp. PLHSN55]|uniref:outer membrane beta-barrel protein n=1 Tax=Thalassotalea sp. PLHSN55 TaxID=3435888 RepID=UPI003F872854